MRVPETLAVDVPVAEEQPLEVPLLDVDAVAGRGVDPVGDDREGGGVGVPGRGRDCSRRPGGSRTARSLLLIEKSPLRMIVPLPTYFAVPDELFALPSMKTVPLIVRVVPSHASLVWPSADVQLYGAPVRSNGLPSRVGALVDRVVGRPARGVEPRRRAAGGGARRLRAEACVQVPEAHVARSVRRVRRAVCGRRPGDGAAAGERRLRDEAGREDVVVDDAPDLVGVPPDAGVRGRVVFRLRSSGRRGSRPGRWPGRPSR